MFDRTNMSQLIAEYKKKNSLEEVSDDKVLKLILYKTRNNCNGMTQKDVLNMVSRENSLLDESTFQQLFLFTKSLLSEVNRNIPDNISSPTPETKIEKIIQRENQSGRFYSQLDESSKKLKYVFSKMSNSGFKTFINNYIGTNTVDIDALRQLPIVKLIVFLAMIKTADIQDRQLLLNSLNKSEDIYFDYQRFLEKTKPLLSRATQTK